MRINPTPSDAFDSGIEKENPGRIIKIIGPALEIAFPPGKVPKCYNAVLVEDIDSMGRPITVRCEGIELLKDNRVLAMARDNLSSFPDVRVGMKVFDSGANYTEEKLSEVIENEIKMTVVKGTPPYFGFDKYAFSKPLVGVESNIIYCLLLLYVAIQFFRPR
jgi:hypothetical protein